LNDCLVWIGNKKKAVSKNGIAFFLRINKIFAFIFEKSKLLFTFVVKINDEL